MTDTGRVTPEARKALDEVIHRLVRERKWDLLAALHQLIDRARVCRHPIRMANDGYMQPVFRLTRRT